MAFTMFSAVVVAFAIVPTQANQCTNGGGDGCASDNVTQNLVSMLQMKLQTNILNADGQDSSRQSPCLEKTVFDCGVTLWNRGGDLPASRWSTLVGCQGSCPTGEGYDRFTWFPKKGNCKCCKSEITSAREVGWSAFSGPLNCPQATCVQPSNTGYDFTNVAGTQTMSGFAPSGVACADGYAGIVTYTPCAAAGDEYQVSGCQQVVARMCAGNANPVEDVDCSEKPGAWQNKGSWATGTTTAECCEPGTVYHFWGTGETAELQNGRIFQNRGVFAKFKQCTDSSCVNCDTDADCGWDRTKGQYIGFALRAEDLDHNEHVGEFWADCAEGTNAIWKVSARNHGSPSEFHNADIKVYLAEEGGSMKGELQDETSHVIEWNLIEWFGPKKAGIAITSGSTRLYVVIRSIDPTKGVSVALDVKIDDAPSAVGDCMDNRMCLRELDSSAEGSQLRNDNLVQLQCLNGVSLSPVALDQICGKWKACLDDHQVDKDLLQAILEASVLTPQQQQQAQPQAGEVNGECAYPANDDVESWECECAESFRSACADRINDLAACVRENMCASDLVCLSWKTAVGCADLSLLSTHSVSVQNADVEAVAGTAHLGRQLPGNISLIESAKLDQSLRGKACARTSR